MTYGTPTYYAELFADFIADVQHDEPQFGDNLIAGFKLAIADWKKYHEQQVQELERIANKVDDEIGLQTETP